MNSKINYLIENFSLSNFKNSFFKLFNNSNRLSLSQDELFVSYRILRYDPTVDEKPWVQVILLKDKEHLPMLLDNLFYIKDYKDASLSFRRSCREGICGSCAMNVNGTNVLACTYKVEDHLNIFKTWINIYPLPHMVIIKDLIINMKHFYNQYSLINPFLIKNYEIGYLNFKEKFNFKKNNNKNFTVFVNRPTIENIQSKQDRKLLDGLYECILCACCTTSCPSYWWNSNRYLGPAVLLQSYRWVIDTRDEDFTNRIEFLDDMHRLNRCHTILNCIRCCPKKLSPATAIGNIKQIINFVNSNN